ncbi:hypothetical protein OHA72_26680 [Dactylosporangium sp. NBC_01737]|uniref:hypothetical protein n=1 Tax=Dactylosporangium sp. NBC_01737 TaxID=2975959 RepID=UPI002E152BB1|nr:hypothetical protein OHA72_26680 [Dactylosporangium sp. NBC_01737]
MPAAQRTAWDAYLTMTRRLLPAVNDETIRPAATHGELRGLVVRIERYAPLWGEHGPMLLAALRGIPEGSDRADVAELLQVIADRLYLISIGPLQSRRDRRGCRRNAGTYGADPPHRQGDCDR